MKIAVFARPYKPSLRDAKLYLRQEKVQEKRALLGGATLHK